MEKHITPEEFLTKAEGFPNSSLNDGKVRLTRPKMIELMRDYAEALYAERIEKAGVELPNIEQVFSEAGYSQNPLPQTLIHRDGIKIGSSIMKQAASVVIAMEREELNHYKKEYAIIRQLLNAAELTIEQKDKEIVELKSEPIKFLKWIAEQDLDNQLTLLDNEWFYESDTDGDQPLEEETLYKNYKTHQRQAKYGGQ